MKYKVAAILSVAVSLLVVAPWVIAHHSDAEYDLDHLSTLKGTVRQFQFINPHVLIHLDAEDDKGNVEQWTTYGSPPNALARVGWNGSIIRPGEQLTITGFRSRYGRKYMLHATIVRANGEMLPIGVAEQNFLRRYEARQRGR